MADYRVAIEDANAHLLRVTLTLAAPAPGQLLALPAWTPGSYVVRDHARRIVSLTARQGGRDVPLQQVDKATWRAACDGGEALVVDAVLQARDASMRAAWVDAERAFIEGSSVLLRAVGRDAEVQRITLAAWPAGWDVATAMPPAGALQWQAADYAEAIDHPFLLGRFWRGSFDLHGVPHEVAVEGAWPTFDGQRLVSELSRLCAAHVAFWHAGDADRRPPFDRYVFLLQAGEDGHGGLEHRASAALQAARRDLPRRGVAVMGEGHARLLALASHEYFHAWNGKRLTAPELAAPDLAREQPTRLLWFFEGVTSYYADRLLLRAGLIDAARWLRVLASQVGALQATPGRLVRSAAQASVDAWMGPERPDPDAPNTTVSVYTKGALVALLLDLSLRERGATLDDVLRALWRRLRPGGPVDIEAILAAVGGLGGAVLGERLRRWIDDAGELPLEAGLARAGVSVRAEPATLAEQIGIVVNEGPLSGVHVRHVLRGGAAEAAGVAPGDELLAADGWRLRRLDDARQWVAAGNEFELTAVRAQRLLALRVRPPSDAAAATLTLHVDAEADAAAVALRRGWLEG